MSFNGTLRNPRSVPATMAKVTLQRAAALSGKARSTIHRALKSGKLSFERDATGTRLIDVAELERAFGVLATPEPEGNGAAELQRHEAALAEARLELALSRQQASMLLERVHELRDERDHWRHQAERLLSSSQPSEKKSWWKKLW
jgi:hypothetical protein